MMVALLLYAYATGRRSSRAIKRACVDDVAMRVVAANQRPDHCTIARLSPAPHETALADLFGDVLALSADAGLVGVAVLADGTKAHADVSHHQNLDNDQIAREIRAEADAADRAEDQRFGDLPRR
jgi:transposase